MDEPAKSRRCDVVAGDESALDRNWAELSPEILTVIMSQLAVVDRLKTAQNVCSSWRKVCRDPYLWRSIDLTYLEEAYDMKRYCTKAIDLSCGGLVSVSVEDYDSDELLNYIADKSSQLKRLRLLRCEHTSDQGFSTAVQKLVFLEELEMSYCSVTQDALKVAAAGRFCPLLKSLKLNQECLKYYNIKSDKEAEAIAENMPGLRHLQLFGNKLTNHGLQAILDRCSQLESLDLRQCFNLQMGGDLEKRCRQQIKDLRCPHDSFDDYFYASHAALSDYGSSDDDYPSGYYGYESPTYDGYDGYSDMLADFELPNADYEFSYDGSFFLSLPPPSSTPHHTPHHCCRRRRAAIAAAAAPPPHLQTHPRRCISHPPPAAAEPRYIVPPS